VTDEVLVDPGADDADTAAPTPPPDAAKKP
jgi:hypothetical protein